MMTIVRSEVQEVRGSDDIVRVRQLVRSLAIEAGLGLVDQTKAVTAASELARNMHDYAAGGTATVRIVEDGTRRGVQVLFEDQGPGIPDIALALTDGFTTGFGLGLGLSGARRLSNEFEITSRPGEGTRILITRWKP